MGCGVVTVFFVVDDCYSCPHECKRPARVYDIRTKGLDDDGRCTVGGGKSLARDFRVHWSLMTWTFEV